MEVMNTKDQTSINFKSQAKGLSNSMVALAQLVAHLQKTV